MEKNYTLGDISKALGISKDTLKYYAKEGILTPEIVDSNGYRYYSIIQLWTLDFIILLRYFEIPIKEIKKIITQKEKNFTLDTLLEQKAILTNDIQLLQKKVENMNWYLEQSSIINDNCEDITVENLDEKSILVIYEKENKDLPHLRLQQEYFKYTHNKDFIPRRYGCILAIDAAKKKEWKIVAEFIVFKSNEILEGMHQTHVATMPAGKYLTMRIHIPCDIMSTFQLVFAYAEKRGITIKTLYVDDYYNEISSSKGYVYTIKALICESEMKDK